MEGTSLNELEDYINYRNEQLTESVKVGIDLYQRGKLNLNGFISTVAVLKPKLDILHGYERALATLKGEGGTPWQE